MALRAEDIGELFEAIKERFQTSGVSCLVYKSHFSDDKRLVITSPFKESDGALGELEYRSDFEINDLNPMWRISWYKMMAPVGNAADCPRPMYGHDTGGTERLADFVEIAVNRTMPGEKQRKKDLEKWEIMHDGEP